MKGLKRENVRERMDDFGLIFNMLGERATIDSQGAEQLQEDA